MNIRLASLADISSIQKLAHIIWPEAYHSIISQEQMLFMLDDMYSQESLKAQFGNDNIFLLVEVDNLPVGFASYSLYNKPQSIFKIHKLYILSQQRGKSLGKMLINSVKEASKAAGGKLLELNVNRENPSLNFYKSIGFKVYEEVNIPYHQYVLNDYVMRLEL